MQQSFCNQFLQGLCGLDAIDDFVDEWHRGETKQTLAHFLGLLEEEYKTFVENPAAFEKLMREMRDRYQVAEDKMCFLLERLVEETKEMTREEYLELHERCSKSSYSLFRICGAHWEHIATAPSFSDGRALLAQVSDAGEREALANGQTIFSATYVLRPNQK